MKDSSRISTSLLSPKDKATKVNPSIFDSSMAEVMICVKNKVKILGEEITRLRNINMELNEQSTKDETQRNAMQAKLKESEDQLKALTNENIDTEAKIAESIQQNKNVINQTKELSESFTMLVKEYESQTNQIVKEETLKILGFEEETKKIKEQTHTEETRNDELKKMMARRLQKRKELEKIISDSESQDDKRLKLLLGEDKGIEMTCSKYEEAKKI